MFDNREIYTRARVAKLSIDTDNPGLRIAWEFIKGKITSSKLASIIFQEKKELERRGVGGFFTSKSFVNILYLSKEYLSNGSIHFEDEKSAAIFLHECSHYLHLVSNCGRYSQKDDEIASTLPPASVVKITPKTRYYVEREAWALSLNIDRIFRLGMRDQINKINTHNMLNVERSLGKRKNESEDDKDDERTMTIDQFHWKD